MLKKINIALSLIAFLGSPVILGMFPHVNMPYKSARDLDVRKIEMREELEDIGLAVQEDVSEENLAIQKHRAQIVQRMAATQDPETAKRANTLIRLIDGKTQIRQDQGARRNLLQNF